MADNTELITGLRDLGFIIKGYKEYPESFGNAVIETALEESKIVFSKDRGEWDCYICRKYERIPVKAAVAIMNHGEFAFEDLAFDEEKVLTDWLKENLGQIRIISEKDLRHIKREWNRITKNRRV